MQLLEANIYDNFNPNTLNVVDYTPPGGNTAQLRPLPKPKALAQVIDYELWETGYQYTSSAVFSAPVEIGDIVQVKTISDIPVALSGENVKSIPLSMFYQVNDVDDDGKATMQNYFWAMLEGVDIPTNTLNTTNANVLTRITSVKTTALMHYGLIYNTNTLSGVTKFNRKSDSTDAKSLAKDMFASIRFQPRVFFEPANDDDGRDTIKVAITSREWSRKNITTRIDEALNPAMETETVVERSNYNYAVVYWKADQDAQYPSSPEVYTINDNGAVVDMNTYTGDGYDLPQQKLITTLFYDEGKPTTAQIKAEITGDTVIHKIYFNIDPKLPLYVNDLVTLWYNGVGYKGYIADRVITPESGRLLFIEGV